MKIYLNHENAVAPTKVNPEDAGWDLYSVETVTIDPHTTGKIPTGIHMSFLPGYTVIIKPRSGLGSKATDIHGGVIDSLYRGEVGVLFHNDSNEVITLEKGSKVAQFIIVPLANKLYSIIQDLIYDLEEDFPCRYLLNGLEDGSYQLVDSLEFLGETSRGSKGFGSSGI